MNKQEYNSVLDTWQKASKVLKFNLITPYKLNILNDEVEVFAYLPEYGSKNGAYVCLIEGYDFKRGKLIPDYSKIRKYSNLNNIFLSEVGYKLFLEYDEKVFAEMLEDWGRFN